MIHYITPGHSDKNLGREINNYVKLVDDNDWICLRDIDTMPAYHEKFFEQCEELAKSDYGLIGCMTNRIGLKHHLICELKSEKTDWLFHRDLGKLLYYRYKHEINKLNFNYEDISHGIAGFFMLFPKKVWNEVGGFKEGLFVDNAFIDWHFSKAVIKKGYKIGLAKGLYLIHMYRPDAQDTRTATQHLR